MPNPPTVPTDEELREMSDECSTSDDEVMYDSLREVRDRTREATSRERQALLQLLGTILRRSDELRKGSQTAAVSIICKAEEMWHTFVAKESHAKRD